MFFWCRTADVTGTEATNFFRATIDVGTGFGMDSAGARIVDTRGSNAVYKWITYDYGNEVGVVDIACYGTSNIYILKYGDATSFSTTYHYNDDFLGSTIDNTRWATTGSFHVANSYATGLGVSAKLERINFPEGSVISSDFKLRAHLRFREIIGGSGERVLRWTLLSNEFYQEVGSPDFVRHKVLGTSYTDGIPEFYDPYIWRLIRDGSQFTGQMEGYGYLLATKTCATNPIGEVFETLGNMTGVTWVIGFVEEWIDRWNYLPSGTTDFSLDGTVPQAIDFGSEFRYLQIGGTGRTYLFDVFDENFSTQNVNIRFTGSKQDVILKLEGGTFYELGTFQTGVISATANQFFTKIFLEARQRNNATLGFQVGTGTEAYILHRGHYDPPGTKAGGGAWSDLDFPAGDDPAWGTGTLSWGSMEVGGTLSVPKPYLQLLIPFHRGTI